MEIHYRDGADDIMTNVNEALEPHGLRFIDDGQEHDGFVVYNIERLTECETFGLQRAPTCTKS